MQLHYIMDTIYEKQYLIEDFIPFPRHSTKRVLFIIILIFLITLQPPEPTEKKPRGRPKGSISRERQMVSSTKLFVEIFI